MSNTFMCGGSKYVLGGIQGDVIFLPVSFTGLPPKIYVQGYTLFLKTELHISLVGIEKLIKRCHITIPNFQEKVVADFCEFTKQHSIDFVRCQDEVRFVVRAERRSVVVMCDLANLDAFFDVLNAKYGLKLPHQPTHVTLYTLQPSIGIFLMDAEDIQSETKIVSVPEISKLIVR